MRYSGHEFLTISFCLFIYCISFFVFYPQCTTVYDEAAYLRQANALSQGNKAILATNPFTGTKEALPPDRYAPGTALLMTPFMVLFGLQGGYLVPLLSLLGTVLLMAKWLRDERKSPMWALLLLTYPPILVLGRVAMSDMVSLFFVTLSLWLFWKGENRRWTWWFFSGLGASLSLLLRETNVLIFFVFFIGALVRRRSRAISIIAGGLTGLLVFFAVEYLFFGTLFQRSDEFRQFSLAHISENLPYYAVTLLVLVPGGLLAALFYRGKWREELILTVSAYTLFFLTWDSQVHGGLMNRLVLHAPRFSMSLMPLLVLALSETVPRWKQKVARDMRPTTRTWMERGTQIVAVSWVVAALLLAAAVHPAFSHWSNSRIEMIRAIADHTEPGAVIISNASATAKFINELYMDRILLSIDEEELASDCITQIQSNNFQVFLVLLYRTDSDSWRERGEKYDNFLRGISTRFKTIKLLDKPFGPTDTLRIWKIEA
jgi:4-amino-4-deoxy-L-arabinose transferase-like glycosyltransferase